MKILCGNLYFYVMLTPRQIQEIVDTIVTGYQPEKVVLFGSYAVGEPNEDSDLDFCIIKKTKIEPLERRREVRRLFVPYQYPMDIFVFTPDEFNKRKNVFGTLQHIVNTEGKVIYGK